jgi:hypothetical protein
MNKTIVSDNVRFKFGLTFCNGTSAWVPKHCRKTQTANCRSVFTQARRTRAPPNDRSLEEKQDSIDVSLLPISNGDDGPVDEVHYNLQWLLRQTNQVTNLLLFTTVRVTRRSGGWIWSTSFTTDVRQHLVIATSCGRRPITTEDTSVARPSPGIWSVVIV